jgi:hypothetical protein
MLTVESTHEDDEQDTLHISENPATVSVPILHPRQAVSARIDAAVFDRWIELGKSMQWFYSPDGITYRDTNGVSCRVADTIMGRRVERYRDGSVFNMTRANLVT